MRAPVSETASTIAIASSISGSRRLHRPDRPLAFIGTRLALPAPGARWLGGAFRSGGPWRGDVELGSRRLQPEAPIAEKRPPGDAETTPPLKQPPEISHVAPTARCPPVLHARPAPIARQRSRPPPPCLNRSPDIPDLDFPPLFRQTFCMKALLQAGLHGRVPVTSEKRFLIWHPFEYYENAGSCGFQRVRIRVHEERFLING